MRHVLLVLTACLLASIPSREAAAQTEEERAVALFEESAARYREGRFKEAVDLLTRAYAIKQEPVLLYNLGRAYEGLGDARAALDAYRRYLEGDPGAADRGAIETRIATLSRQLEERAALERQRDAAARRDARPDRPQPAQGSPSPLPWIVAGVGVGGLGAGAVLGLLSGARHADAKAGSALAAEGLQGEAEDFAIAANVAFIAGGAIAAAGLVWGIVDLTTAGDPPASVARLVVSAGPGSIRLSCAF